MHLFADVGDVGEDRLLIALAEELRRRDRVALLACGREQRGVRGVQRRVEAGQQLC